MNQVTGLAVVALLACSGCSVGMALSGTEQKDTSIIFPGAPRAVVIAKLGPPETTTKDETGNYIDSYLVVQGNAPSTGRAVAHGALDIATLGLWEVVGSAYEVAGNENKERATRFMIYYDEDDEIRDAQSVVVGSAPKDVAAESPPRASRFRR